MNKPLKTWRPTKQVSKGANMYHKSVASTAWYDDNLKLLLRGIKKIKNGNIVVDFGAGTGMSSIFILKNSKSDFNLWLVDNSPSWLGKAYQLLKNNSMVDFYMLEKKGGAYCGLADTVGFSVVDLILSANTIHLIPHISETVNGMYNCLKPGGMLAIQSGNIKHAKTNRGALLIDTTIEKVHQFALGIIKKHPEYLEYRTGLKERVNEEKGQRKRIFPDPRSLAAYINVLKKNGFINIKTSRRLIKVRYSDWLKFLKIRRIQAGILPEIGGRTPTATEENDRDAIITSAANKYFDYLRVNNPKATRNYFIAEWTYLEALKPS